MLFSHARVLLISTMSGVLCSPVALTDTLGFWSPTAAQVEIADRLDSFESTAASTRTEIDLYAAAVRSGNLHLQSYIGDLEQIKEHVNLFGKETDRTGETSHPRNGTGASGNPGSSASSRGPGQSCANYTPDA